MRKEGESLRPELSREDLSLLVKSLSGEEINSEDGSDDLAANSEIASEKSSLAEISPLKLSEGVLQTLGGHAAGKARVTRLEP